MVDEKKNEEQPQSATGKRKVKRAVPVVPACSACGWGTSSAFSPHGVVLVRCRMVDAVHQAHWSCKDFEARS